MAGALFLIIVLGAMSCAAPGGFGDETLADESSEDTPHLMPGLHCGDGRVDGREACDDGNHDAGDGCDACVWEPGFVCGDTSPSTCTAVCGDGIVVGAETCDDMNYVSGDGCSACVIDVGYSCHATEAGSACAPVCGDGIVRAGEACDDGNVHPGDGCGPSCAPEPGYCCDPQEGHCIQQDTFAVVDAATPIVDAGYDGTLASMTCVQVQVAGAGNCNHGLVHDVRVELGIEHPRVGELTIKMVAPDGLRTTLTSIPGYDEVVDGAPERLGAVARLLASAPVVFDEQQQGAVDAETLGHGLGAHEAVCTGDGRCAFIPNPGAAEGVSGLQDFFGTAAGGAWSICVGDVSPDNVGSIESVRLIYRAM